MAGIFSACILFTDENRLKVPKYAAYHEFLQLTKQRPSPLFLDIGCGVGNDTRKVVADGFPAKQIVASDLHPGEPRNSQ